MARKIEYDSTKVQQSLTDLFWHKGFAETSLADIEAASGLNRRQLYNGNGDKRAMGLTEAIDLRTDAVFGVHVVISVLLRAGRPREELDRMVDQALNDLRV